MANETSSEKMDTRDYRLEITGLMEKREALGRLLGWRVVTVRFLGLVEKVARKPLASRQMLSQTVDRLTPEWQSLNGEIERLTAIDRQLEEVQGALQSCPRCGVAFRSRWGVFITPSQSRFLVDERDEWKCEGKGESDWYCRVCGDEMTRQYREIAAVFAGFVGVFKGDMPPSCWVVEKDYGWMTTSDEYDDIEQVKDDLKRMAARRLANACLGFWYEVHHERVIGEYGPKGNPYYRAKKTFSGKARAVCLVKNKSGRC